MASMVKEAKTGLLRCCSLRRRSIHEKSTTLGPRAVYQASPSAFSGEWSQQLCTCLFLHRCSSSNLQNMGGRGCTWQPPPKIVHPASLFARPCEPFLCAPRSGGSAGATFLHVTRLELFGEMIYWHWRGLDGLVVEDTLGIPEILLLQRERTFQFQQLHLSQIQIVEPFARTQHSSVITSHLRFMSNLALSRHSVRFWPRARRKWGANIANYARKWMALSFKFHHIKDWNPGIVFWCIHIRVRPFVT